MEDGTLGPEKDISGLPGGAKINFITWPGSTLGVPQRCMLLDWEGTNEIVARGKISAVDPTSRMHGYKLGPDCFRFDIEEPVNPRAEFYRSQPEFSAMEDAVGSTIMWPIKYIIPHTRVFINLCSLLLM
ncbi:hypothetical protein OROHE_005855 [Orobanche hederae]